MQYFITILLSYIIILAAEVCFFLKPSYESVSSIKIDRQKAKWKKIRLNNNNKNIEENGKGTPRTNNNHSRCVSSV